MSTLASLSKEGHALPGILTRGIPNGGSPGPKPCCVLDGLQTVDVEHKRCDAPGSYCTHEENPTLAS
jgi:hypothetical protein